MPFIRVAGYGCFDEIGILGNSKTGIPCQVRNRAASYDNSLTLN
jgi:hypothetical protein